MSEVKEKEFQLFFADKANVNMSSYKMDVKTQLLVLYLKDQKSALWEKFSATYPDGMKRTSFMFCLQNSRFKYREDLEELCITCNDYGYQPFENLIELDQLIHELEYFRCHLKQNYERELSVNKNGTTDHTDCIYIADCKIGGLTILQSAVIIVYYLHLKNACNNIFHDAKNVIKFSLYLRWNCEFYLQQPAKLKVNSLENVVGPTFTNDSCTSAKLKELAVLLPDYTIPTYTSSPVSAFKSFLRSQKSLVLAYLTIKFAQHTSDSIEYYTTLHDKYFLSSLRNFIDSALSVECRSIVLDRVLVILDSKLTLLTDPTDIKLAAVAHFQSVVSPPLS
ncbi:unnamed protein product [Rhizophagus irregularis]|nr:unnamed protein product [Rhizophagus irregularis]